jgi:hypothetical protein
MSGFKARRHRLEIPAMPNSDDPAVLKRALDQMKRLVQDEFNRLSTDFYDFKKATYDAGVLPLRAVSQIALTFDEFSVAATWELPDGQEVEPTHVRVRILEISPDTWAEYTYPKTSWEFNGLDPGTQYTFQVQLVARFEATESFVSATRNCPSVPVLRLAESDIRSKVFTTDEGVGPPTDGGTNDTNITFTFPDTDGTPGAVDSTDCWWGYKFQYRTACAWADTAVSEAFAAGDVGTVAIDSDDVPFTTYPNSVFRLAYREICDGVAQGWVYGTPFMAVDYSDPDCFGIAKSASDAVAPFTIADNFKIPGVCQQDGTALQIVDVLTDTEFLTQSPGFSCVEYIDNEWTLIGADTSDPAISPTIFQPMLSGGLATIAAITSTQDFSFAMDIKIPDNALLLAGGSGAYTIVNIGNVIKINIIQNTTGVGFQVQVLVPREGGGQYDFRTSFLAYGAWNEIAYVQDTSEANGRKLYANGILDAESTNAFEVNVDANDGTLQINTVNDMQLRKVAMWNSVVNFSGVPTAGLSHWWDTSALSGSNLPDIQGNDDLVLVGSTTGTEVGLDGVSYPVLSTSFDEFILAVPDENLLGLKAADSDILTFFWIIKLPPTGDFVSIFSRIDPGVDGLITTILGSDGRIDVNMNRNAINRWVGERIDPATDMIVGGVWFIGFAELSAAGSGYVNMYGPDGAQLTTTPLTGAGTLSVSEPPFNMMSADGAGLDPLEGSFPHLLVWNKALSLAERQAVAGYFATQGWS